MKHDETVRRCNIMSDRARRDALSILGESLNALDHPLVPKAAKAAALQLHVLLEGMLQAIEGLENGAGTRCPVCDGARGTS